MNLSKAKSFIEIVEDDILSLHKIKNLSRVQNRKCNNDLHLNENILFFIKTNSIQNLNDEICLIWKKCIFHHSVFNSLWIWQAVLLLFCCMVLIIIQLIRHGDIHWFGNILRAKLNPYLRPLISFKNLTEFGKMVLLAFPIGTFWSVLPQI